MVEFVVAGVVVGCRGECGEEPAFEWGGVAEGWAYGGCVALHADRGGDVGLGDGCGVLGGVVGRLVGCCAQSEGCDGADAEDGCEASCHLCPSTA